MDVYAKIAVKIIQHQEDIIGPIALEQAKKVAGLSVDWSKREVSLAGDEGAVLDALVNQYKLLFGQMAVHSCRDTAMEYVPDIPKGKLPRFLA